MAGELLGSLPAAAASVWGTMLNVSAQKEMNKANIKNQNELNRRQLDFSKNAYTYATADRLRAGLSPLDANAATTPALNMAEQQAPDYSGIAGAGQAITGGINNALDRAIQKKRLENETNFNNALVAKTTAEIENINAQTMEAVTTLQSKLNKYDAEITNLKDQHSTYAREKEAQIEQLQAQTKELLDLIKRNNALLPSQIGLNESSAGRNNAEALATQSDLSFAEKLGVPFSLIKTFDFRNPQSTLIFDSLKAKLKNNENLSEGTLKQLYDVMTEERDTRMAELELEYNEIFGKNPGSPRLKEILAEKKSLERLPKTFKEYKKQYERQNKK